MRMPLKPSGEFPLSILRRYEARAILNHGKSLEQITADGGLTPHEVAALILDIREAAFPSDQDAYLFLAKELERHRVIPYMFVRQSHFYFVQCIDDYDAQQNADYNPGTVEVQNLKGETVWSAVKS